MTKEEKKRYDQQYYLKNKGKRIAQTKAYYADNKEKMQAYYKETRSTKEVKAKKAAYDKEYGKDNRGKKNASNAKRHAAKLQRTVGWSDELVISMIYADCPEGHHVDHIIPLQGEKVSGLHVAWNLQYLTAEENLAKGNKYTIAESD